MGQLESTVGQFLLGIGLLFPAISAYADDTQVQGSQIAEVVVTAERKSERLQDVPAAVSAFSSDDLARGAVHGLADVLVNVPSIAVSMPYGDGGPPNFSIRGISSTDFTPVQSKPVAIYMDEAIRNFQLFEMIPIFDIDRVEVLRGPQGTLYGKNATAGAVNIISRRPTFDTEGYLTAGVGNFDRRSAQGAFQTPIIDHVLAARVAFTYTKDDGVIRNLIPGVGNLSQTDIYAVRASVYFEPSADFNATLRYSHTRSSGRNYAPLASPTDFSNFPNLQSIPGIDRAGLGFYESQILTAPKRDILVDEVNLLTEWKLSDHYTLNSVSAFSWGKWNDISDGGAGLPLTNWDTANTFTRAVHQLVQELRLTSRLEGPFNWMAGASYSEDHIIAAFTYDFLGDPRCGSPCDFGIGFGGTGFYQNLEMEQKRSSYSGFLRGEYQVLDALKLSAGVRQSYDRLDVPSYNSSIGDSGCGNCIPTIVDVSKRASFNNTSVEAGLDWTFSPNVLAYATFKQGYRTGAVNAQAFNDPSEVTIAPPETVNSEEVGIKTTLLDRRLLLDLAAFNSDYKNQQIITAVGALFPLRSIPESRIRGAELELKVRPIDAVGFDLGVSVIDPKYRRGVINGAEISGKQIAGSAKVNGRAGVELTLAANGDNRIHLNLNETFQSKVYNDTADTERIAQPHLWMTNGRISYDADRYSVAAYGKNLFNAKSYTAGLDLLPSFGLVYWQRIMPRTFGVEATVRF